ncbi:MAG: glycosyltransferase [Planctomycetia bacterium]|nr:glycosyltransferase [Planctomycetia bacterium]
MSSMQLANDAAAQPEPAPSLRPAGRAGETLQIAAGRMAFIDSMRALAALAVFAFHIRPFVDGFAGQFVGRGWLGVQVFFAISGFVIALSVAESRISPAYVVRFILRRSIRLDPPYWCVIAVTVCLLIASNAVRSDRPLPLPGPAAIGAHLLYLQDLLGYGDIVDIFWSLCIEFQFYLVFIVLLGFVQALSADGCSLRGKAGFAAIVLFSGLGIASFLSGPIFKLPPKIYFLTYWNEFFVGVLCAWALHGRIRAGWCASYFAVAAAAAAFVHWNLEVLTAIATAIVIFSFGKLGTLQHGLAWRPLTMLGRMSYSFYLVHTLVLSRLTRILERSGASSDIKPYIIIPAGFAISLAVAGLLYWLVERPCVRLSKRFKSPRGVDPLMDKQLSTVSIQGPQEFARAERVELRPFPDRPLVTVIVPSYNQGKFIRKTLESIFDQNYEPLEVLVIDGASRDETLDVLKSFGARPGLKWVSEPDRGVVEAVNKGLAAAQGDILAIQSSDDCYTTGAIARAVREFAENPRVGLIYGDTVKIDEHGNDLSRQRIGAYSLENLFLLKTWIPQPSAFFRRELFDAIGGWNERIPYAPDTDFWIRMAFRTEVRKLDEYLSQRRVHDAQRDVHAARIVRDYDLMIEQSADIRQAAGHLQQAAHAGKHLLRVRYNPHNSDWYAAWALIRAAWIYPRSLRWKDIVRYSCIQPVRRCGSRVKRSLRKMLAGGRVKAETLGS